MTSNLILPLMLICFSLSACSTYPLTQDVTGYNTYAIVRRVRCETRDAFMFFVKRAVAKRKDQVIYERKLGVEVYEELKNDEDLKRYDFNKFNKELGDTLKEYKQSTVASEFTFNITESNGQSFDATLLRTFITKRTDTIGASTSNSRMRNVRRFFTIYDTVEDLIKYLPIGYCDDLPKDENYVYPITGQLNIVDLVQNFLDLNQSGNLKSNTPIADTIMFTTKLSGTVSPMFVLTPLTNSFNLTGVTSKFDNSREDIHQVVISINLPPNPFTLARIREQHRLANFSLSDASREIAAAELDRQKERAVQDSLIRLGTNVSQFLQ